MNQQFGTPDFWVQQTGFFALSGIVAPVMSLVGVFLDSNSAGPIPANLDFSIPGGLAFDTLAPQLRQVFFIGDGLTGRGSGNRQEFHVPAGADHLYLGLLDVPNFDNAGFLNVAVSDSPHELPPNPPGTAPEPGTFALAGLCLAGLAASRRRVR